MGNVIDAVNGLNYTVQSALTDKVDPPQSVIPQPERSTESPLKSPDIPVMSPSDVAKNLFGNDESGKFNYSEN